ncbi:hypothetical protein Syun_025148 [Stephania yunnanensis]|uniref:Uncharacterized protein n=1 Tax=Stephania yunnanensis TaxID=152371 RepID=A0AAP0EWN8_9MAGN
MEQGENGVLLFDGGQEEKGQESQLEGKDKMQPQGGIMKKESKCFFYKRRDT